MSAAMDRGLMAMSLDEDDEAFDMTNLQEYNSCESIVTSLI